MARGRPPAAGLPLLLLAAMGLGALLTAAAAPITICLPVNAPDIIVRAGKSVSNGERLSPSAMVERMEGFGIDMIDAVFTKTLGWDFVAVPLPDFSYAQILYMSRSGPSHRCGRWAKRRRPGVVRPWSDVWAAGGHTGEGGGGGPGTVSHC